MAVFSLMDKQEQEKLLQYQEMKIPKIKDFYLDP
jgi:hypothetical protein